MAGGRRSIDGDRPVARPALRDVAQSRSASVPSLAVAMHPARDIGPVAVHDLSLEFLRGSAGVFRRAGGLPSRNEHGRASDSGTQTRAVHANDPQ